MKIQVEDYFGNDVLILDYKLVDSNRFPYNVEKTSKIAENNGYNIADMDTDDNGCDVIRVQQENVDNAMADEKKDLINMINEFNTNFI